MFGPLIGPLRPRASSSCAAVLSLTWALVGTVASAGPAPSPDGEPACRREIAAGREFLRQLRFEEARESFTLAAADCPQDPEAWSGLGRAALETGDASTALSACRQALRLVPHDLDRREALGAAHAALAGVTRASADSALGLYLSVLQEDPSRVATYHAAADVAARLADLPTTIMLRMQARLVSGDTGDGGRPEALGRELLNAKLYSEAIRVYRDCAARDPDDLECRRVDAHLRFRLGRWEEAAGAYEAILLRAPESTTAESEERNRAECLTRLGRWDDAISGWDRLAARSPEIERYVCESCVARWASGRARDAMRIAEVALQRHPDWACLLRWRSAGTGGHAAAAVDPACLRIGLTPGVER